MTTYDEYKKKWEKRKEEIKQFQEKLKNDKNFERQWLEEQNAMFRQVKKELFG